MSFTGADYKKAAVLEKLKQSFPKKIDLNFTGSSPPAVFVGRWNYPNIFAGILSPAEHDTTSFRMNAPESWVGENLSIDQVLALRGQMVYGRFKTTTKEKQNRLKEVMREVAIAIKPADIEFFLKKKPSLGITLDKIDTPMANPAPLSFARLQGNISVDKHVDSFVNDPYVRSQDALKDLHKRKITNTLMAQVLSVGLLGMKNQRKMVPSRWAITAVDSALGNALLTEIKEYPWIDGVKVLEDEYCGNHFMILLLPREFNFEVIEIGEENQETFWRDYEFYNGRKTYASSVTGFYYAGKLAVTEYLRAIKKQASVIIMREIKKGYWAHLGVGILRESCRRAVKKNAVSFATVDEAINFIRGKMIINVDKYVARSKILEKYTAQKMITDFLW